MSTELLRGECPRDLRTRTTVGHLREASHKSWLDYSSSLSHTVRHQIPLGRLQLELGHEMGSAGRVARDINGGSEVSYKETKVRVREEGIGAAIGVYVILDWINRGFGRVETRVKEAQDSYDPNNPEAAHERVWQGMQALAYPIADARAQVSAAGVDGEVGEQLLRLSQFFGYAADLFSVTSYDPETGQVKVTAPRISEDGWHEGYFTAGQKQGAEIVLIAEDPSFVAALRRRWQRQGFEDVYATTGPEDGLDAIFHSAPKEVLAELDMSGMNGLEFATRVRENHAKGASFLATSPIPQEYIDHVVGVLGAQLHPTAEFAEEALRVH